jgi:hypothetical protein
MTNIRCRGNREIDLLSINPKTLEKHHVEARISTTFKLRLEATYTKDGRCHKDGVDYFNEKKFEHPIVKQKIHELFGDSNYHKVLIVWDVQNKSVIEESRRKYGINVWSMKKVLTSLIVRSMGRGAKYPKGSRDDVLRMEFLALGFGITYGKQKERKAQYKGTS